MRTWGVRGGLIALVVVIAAVAVIAVCQLSQDTPVVEDEAAESVTSEETPVGEVRTTPEPPATPEASPTLEPTSTPAPTATSGPTDRPQPTITPEPPEIERVSVEKSISVGEASVLEHPKGARIVIPQGATGPVIPDTEAREADPHLTGAPESLIVSIEETDTPQESLISPDTLFDITIVDEDGDDVPLREPVEITLPYTLPEGKNEADLLAVYWDEELERWERLEGAVVDTETQTVSVEADHLTGVGLTVHLNPVEALAFLTFQAIGEDSIGELYESGYKIALTLRGDVNIPVKVVGAKLGASLVIDINDISSMSGIVPEDSPSSTVEGRAGYFTFGLNAHAAVTDPLVRVSGKLGFSMPLTGEYGTTGYNNDLSFDSSISLASVSLFEDTIGLEGPILNQNGNVDPIDLQVKTCPQCQWSFSAGAHGASASEHPLGAEVELLPLTFNLMNGEFNTNLGRVVGNIAQGNCNRYPCKISWSSFIEHFLNSIIQGPFQTAFEQAQDIELIYQYTGFEHRSPTAAATIGSGFVNMLEDYTGGLDVNGDGLGDFVFPPGVPGGVPLQIWTTGDRFEKKRHFLELVEITDGWRLEADNANMHPSLNHSIETPSEDAILRVDYDALALTMNPTSWRVFVSPDAPDTGRLVFRLKENVAFHPDTTLESEVSFRLLKRREFSDLLIQADASPDPLRQEETLTYTVSVENRGPEQAHNVEVQMFEVQNLGLVLRGAHLERSSLACEVSPELGNLICPLGDMHSGDRKELTLDFKLEQSLRPDTAVSASFSVAAEGVGLRSRRGELNPNDNSATATVATAPTSDRDALIALYNATGGQNWLRSRHWLSEKPVGQWYGVRTDDRGRVVGLDLYYNRLIGQLPSQLEDLIYLEELSLSSNRLSGPIPTQLGNLSNLNRLLLGGNKLIGSIPTTLGDLSNLERAYLSDNNLQGAIPAELGNLQNLQVLSLARNDLSGPLPSNFGSMTQLQELRLYENSLTGPLPIELTTLPNLQHLYLEGNQFSGCIPEGLSNVPNNDLHTLNLKDCGAGSVPPAGPPFTRNPELDLDQLAALDKDHPWGIWSDGSVVWVSFYSVDHNIYAFDLATGQRIPGEDFNSLAAAGNHDAHGLWSDGQTMWVADRAAGRIFAYSLATKVRDPAEDFHPLAPSNSALEGIWSDGTTMWVSDLEDHKLYAYDMATKEWIPFSDIPANFRPTGLWSDGETIWVGELDFSRIYAYDIATKARVESKEFDTLLAAGNERPTGLWSDGATMWVVDVVDERVYAYNMPPKASGPSVESPEGKAGEPFARNPSEDFDELDLFDYNGPHGIWSDGTTMWVVTDTVDGELYAYNLATKARDTAKDFNTLASSGNDRPNGIWSDSTTMWVTDWVDDKIYAYDMATKARDATKDFNTLASAGNRDPHGIWSDGTTMWVMNIFDKIYAYDMASKARDATKDFDTLASAGNDRSHGIWSDGTTMWVADGDDDKIYAYDMATKARDTAKDFNTLNSTGNIHSSGIWSDGTTMWVADAQDDKIYAYNMPPQASGSSVESPDRTTAGPGVFQRNPAEDFIGLAGHGNNRPWGLWSDGKTMWVSDEGYFGRGQGKIYAYDMRTKARVPAKEFDTLGPAGNWFSLGIWSDGSTMWVADAFANRIFAYDLHTKEPLPREDFDTLLAAGNDHANGIWSDGSTMWVVDWDDRKIYAYDLATKARKPSEDFNGLEPIGPYAEEGIWSDRTTLWLVQSGADTIFAYDLRSKERVPDRDINVLTAAGNTHPWGIWSDGTTLWVADAEDARIYAYNMP